MQCTHCISIFTIFCSFFVRSRQQYVVYTGRVPLLLTDVRPDALLGIGGKLFLIPVMLAGRALLILRLKGRK